MIVRLRPILAVLLLVAVSAPAQPVPRAAITYLLPAPKEAVVFAPFVLAESRGYYAAQGLDVTFRVVPGGVNVGEALSRGEGDLGGASGDTPILLRDRGFAVRGVALLGGHAFLTLMTDSKQHMSSVRPATLEGKRFGVPAFADVSFYALDAMRRKAGLASTSMSVVALPPASLWDKLGKGELDGIVGTVDWGVRAQRGGATLDHFSSDRYFPAMAQAILASDEAIKTDPRAIRAFVRATLRAVGDIRRDPAGSARAYRAVMPKSDLSEAEIATVFSRLSDYVYAGQRVPGAFDMNRVRALQDAYLALKLVTRRQDPRLFFTNRFTH